MGLIYNVLHLKRLTKLYPSVEKKTIGRFSSVNILEMYSGVPKGPNVE
jgi:hypothetical protein